MRPVEIKIRSGISSTPESEDLEDTGGNHPVWTPKGTGNNHLRAKHITAAFPGACLLMPGPHSAGTSKAGSDSTFPSLDLGVQSLMNSRC